MDTASLMVDSHSLPRHTVHGAAQGSSKSRLEWGGQDGAFTFTQAKVIDIAWDIIIGRGGQALLAYLSWFVFARYVTSSMQVKPVTFNTFRTFFVNRDASTVVGTVRLIYDFFFRHSLQSKAAMIFMITTMVFVLIFPSFASAMTGYSANVEPFIKDQSSNYVPLKNLRLALYTIHDGDRISESRDFIVKSEGHIGVQSPPCSGVCYDMVELTLAAYSTSDLLARVTDYVLRYGTNGYTKNATVFGGRHGVQLGPPSLNITAHYIPASYAGLYSYIVNSMEHMENGTLRSQSGQILNLVDHSLTTWSDDNNFTYSSSDIDERGKCQPIETYKWGFSFIQLFIFICLLICWAVGIFILHVHSHRDMTTRGYKDPIVGEHRAVFQLANAMVAQLDQVEGEEPETSEITLLSDQQLSERIGKKMKGGSISYQAALTDNSDACGNASTWQRFYKAELWWSLLVLIAVAGFYLTIFLQSYFIASYLAPTQIVISRYIGQSTRSRLVLLFWQLLVLGGIPTAAMVGWALKTG